MAVAQAKIAAMDCPIQKDIRYEIAPLSTMAAGKTKKKLSAWLLKIPLHCRLKLRLFDLQNIKVSRLKL